MTFATVGVDNCNLKTTQSIRIRLCLVQANNEESSLAQVYLQALCVGCYWQFCAPLVSLHKRVNDLKSYTFIDNLVVLVGPKLADNITLGVALTVVGWSYDLFGFRLA
jgi:hypothetical protein